MSNQQAEMKQIRRLIGIWINEIRLNTYENYTDINKVGEHLSRQLLNKIYDYQLEDLNQIKANFPGLDIGDQKKDMVAYQVTSRTDRKKVIENLETVVKEGFHKTFTNGIRFLVLNDTDKVSFGPKAKKTPASVLSTFKVDEDIIYPQNLIKKIEDIYEKEADLLKFNQIKLLLEKELIPIASGKPALEADAENEKLKNLLTATLEKLTEAEDKEVKISSDFFHGNLKVPNITVISPRQSLVNGIWEGVKAHDMAWIQGAPSTGKTSLALLLSKKTAGQALWIECRDMQSGQLMEHILNSLARHFNIPIGRDYEGTLDKIVEKFDPETLLILNDLTDIHGNALLQQHLGLFISFVASKGIHLLATSNHPLPAGLATAYNLDIDSIPVAPFEEADTLAILEQLGVPKETAALFSGVITETTEGHPLLIQSAGKYLKEKNWSIDAETISTMFSGKFGDAAERESYARVLAHTADAETRDFLYRLQCVIGSFDIETIQRVSAVSPAISHPGEKINQVKGIWLQDNGDGNFQLSPLIKLLDGNIPPDTEKEVCNQLAIGIIKKKNISQIDAFAAIYYFIKAEQYNRATFILFKVLTEFVQRPELFFDWGFDLYWFNERFPKGVVPLFKVQIRILQITICHAMKKDADFLISDLRQIVTTEEIGLLGQAAANILFFQLEHTTNPMSAFRHLAQAQTEFQQIKESPIHADLFNDELINGIWLIFSQIHTKVDYDEWFQLYKTIQVPLSVNDPYKNTLYVMAGISIYRNAILKNKESGEDITALLHWLIHSTLDCGLPLLSTYALKFLAKYLIEDRADWPSAIELLETYEQIWRLDPLYKFLFFAELGSRYFYSGNIDEADFYFNELRNIELPDAIYTEVIDYLIGYMQVAYKKDPEFSARLVEKALETVLPGSLYLLEDKVKLYGETAITMIRNGNLAEALDLYEKGYIMLLENFTNTEEQQALVIRYGNALKYLIELLETGEALSFGAEKFVIPETGYFYRTNTELLKDKFYFDERKFMGATALQAGFESLSDLKRAKKWAYKSFELSQELPDAKFIAILQANLFYLIQDRQFRQAYNIQAYLDAYYNRLKQKLADGDALDEGLTIALRILKVNDLSVYFFILLPITFSFSQDIVHDRIHREQYQMMIDDAFSSDQYAVKDTVSFAFAKQLFERIMLDNISYQQMQKLFQAYHGEFRDILYIIGCLLLSSFTGATEAANLHLAVIIELDNVMKKSKPIYRFCMVPYFEEFWKQKFIKYPNEFSDKEHFYAKGFVLIEKTDLQKKIATLFRVLSNHLTLHISSSVQDFIGND